MSSDTVVDFSNRSHFWISLDEAEYMLEAVLNCTNLEILNLSENFINPDFAIPLSKILKMKKKLKVLKLNNVFVTSPETQIVYCLTLICKALVYAECSLEELDIGHNTLGPSGIKALSPLFTSRVLFSLKRLFLHNCGISLTTVEILAEFFEILLTNFENATGESHPLCSLVINQNRVDTRGIAKLCVHFKRFPNLTHLNLRQNPIYLSGIIALTRSLTPLTHLQYLNINGSTITEEAAPHLAFILSHFTELRHLDAGDCLIGDAGMKLIAKAFNHSQPRGLKYLDFSYNELYHVESALSLLDAISYLFQQKNHESTEEESEFYLSLNGNYFGKHAIKIIQKKSQKVGMEPEMLAGFEKDQLPESPSYRYLEDDMS